MVAGDGPNEILQYLNARYIGAPEAAWRLLGNCLHKENPKVQWLVVHLPGKQRVIYDPDDSVEVIQDKAENVVTTLMGYFDYNRLNPEARAYTYHDFPQKFVWSDKKWPPLKKHFSNWENFEIQDSVVDSKVDKFNTTRKHLSVRMGKTFLYRTLVATRRSNGDVVLTVSSCGVTALLQTGGRASHSAFKIPLEP
ncbi:uncharacterized protein LOC113360506 [Papaver somniferum]|uniref:uncharacterized protein LOC113360506 n=1 Tax=Papaver somniferum TaxID=3469 RepID=UPI000E6F90FD|nr:uncharacterized protein LOC113360506 [Papaver somniferum]